MIILQKSDKANKYKDIRDYKKATEGYEMKVISDLSERDNFYSQKRQNA